MNEKELYNLIDKILWNHWDPIGIRSLGGPRDEYYGYISEIFELVMSGANKEIVAGKLNSFAVDQMGLAENMDQNLFVAELILAEYNRNQK